MPVITRWSRLAILAALTAAGVAAATAAAQSFPAKPIRVVVGFPAGGPADIFARTMGQKLSELVGQQVIVDNRAGAGGLIAGEIVAKSPADGYTTYLASAGAMAISPSLVRQMPYNAMADFAPITIAVRVPEALAVHPSLPARTLKELVALGKARPGELLYCSSGNGSMPHLAAESLRIATGIRLTHVPYKGAAPAVTDMLGGHTHLGFWDLPILLPHIRSAKLRPIILASGARSPSLPDLPTSAEAGYPSVNADNWYGIFAPAATPRDVLSRLNAGMSKALQSPDVRDRLAAQGAATVGGSSEELAAFLRSETEKWARVIKTAGITLE